jgi:hypothetical protein
VNIAHGRRVHFQVNEGLLCKRTSTKRYPQLLAVGSRSTARRVTRPDLICALRNRSNGTDSIARSGIRRLILVVRDQINGSGLSSQQVFPCIISTIYLNLTTMGGHPPHDHQSGGDGAPTAEARRQAPLPFRLPEYEHRNYLRREKVTANLAVAFLPRIGAPSEAVRRCE